MTGGGIGETAILRCHGRLSLPALCRRYANTGAHVTERRDGYAVPIEPLEGEVTVHHLLRQLSRRLGQPAARPARPRRYAPQRARHPHHQRGTPREKLQTFQVPMRAAGELTLIKSFVFP